MVPFSGKWACLAFKNVFFSLEMTADCAFSTAVVKSFFLPQMALAEILDSNPQEFIMEAYADPLKYYPPDPPNNTNPQEALVRSTQKII
jgi:hypothetical protein